MRKLNKPVFPQVLNSDKDRIIDEALERAYKHRAKFTGTTDHHLLGWVLRILKNHTLDILKARKNKPKTTVMQLKGIEDKKFPNPALAAQEAETGSEAVNLPPKAQAWLDQANDLLNMLSNKQQEVFRLCHGVGLTPREAPSHTVSHPANFPCNYS